MTETARRFMRLFEGYAGAHGTHGDTKRSEAKGGKLEIKGTARTVREPVTEELWDEHLAGTKPIGIIPIREDSQCVWGCVDVDKYDLVHGEIVEKLSKLKLPLVVCKSKSGGAHLMLFLSRPEPAEALRSTLRQVAASLGWGDCEVFPKQNQILADRGDLGNWLNMPYLAGDKTERYAVKANGLGMTTREFLDVAEARRTELSKIKVRTAPTEAGLDDGPPCLQHLTSVGFPDGTRNNGLFALGTFCKKAFGERWREKLEEYNRDFMSLNGRPPVSADEVAEVIRSLEKRDYQYKCKDQPIVSFCNAVLCRTRKYGVTGGNGRWPVISGMSKLTADPPLWFVDLENESVRVELTTEDLQDYRRFQRVCMEKLSIMFMPVKANDWNAMVSEAMVGVQDIEAPPEVSTLGHFRELLQEFLTNRYAGKSEDDLLLGKPWMNEEDGNYYFRLRDLMSFLERENFRLWGRNTVGQRVSEIGGKKFRNLRGTGTNLFFVRGAEVGRIPDELPLPDSRGEPV